MSRWLPTIGAGLVLAVAATVILAALGTGREPSAAERVDALAAELRCPDCQGLAVADSPTSSAREIRRQIEALVAGGASDDEVRAHFVDRYGEWILLAPSHPLTWIVPVAAVVLALGGVGLWLARGPRPSPPSTPLTERERAALREEAEALDA